MLRDYQKKAIEQIETAANKNIMLCMATGSGKTYTFCELAKRHYVENLERVLILVHREELLQQAYDSLGERCFRIEKGVKQIPSDFDYYVGMVETINRRLSKIPEFGLVIIDEAHIGNFAKMPFFDMESVKVIGVTATPIAKKPLANYYNKLITPITISELITSKFLVDTKVYAFASDLVDKAKFKVKRGEFDEKQMEDFYSSEKMVNNVINAYWSHAAGKKTIIFNVNINHNNAVYKALKQEGLNAYVIDGGTPKPERKKLIEDYKNDPHGIICNVGVLTAGFDDPSIECVILNRATKSLALYLQMVGRGARIFEGKENCLVLDLGKNTTRHGFYDKQHDWLKYFNEGTEKDKDSVGAAPTKECPECGFIQHTRVIECGNCGHDFVAERERQEKEEKEQKLYLLIKENPINIPLQKIFDLADDRNWKPYAVIWKIAEHIVKYSNRYSTVVTDEYIESLALENLTLWCKKYQKKNNKWHRDFIMDCIKKTDEKVRG